MTQIILDATTRERLATVTERGELCDDSGPVLGRFLPAFDPSRYEGLEPQISKEELQRRKQSKGKTYTTAEVLAYLEKL
jgi:hypothetical protein